MDSTAASSVGLSREAIGSAVLARQSERRYNLLDASTLDNPYRVYDELRHTAPVYRTTKSVYAAYEQRTLRKGFDDYNPSASEQVAELEAEQECRQHATT